MKCTSRAGDLQRLLVREAQIVRRHHADGAARRAGGARRRGRRSRARRCWCPAGFRRAGTAARGRRRVALGRVDDALQPRERRHEVRQAELERVLHADAGLQIARRQSTAAPRRPAPPACASTVFRPIARSSVLLPDMFDPVTSSSVPGGPTWTSLPTRRSSGISGCPSAAASSTRRRRRRSGMAPAGIVARRRRQRDERVELAERVDPAAHVAARRARASARARRARGSPTASAPESESAASPRRVPQLAEAEDAIQAAHARGRLPGRPRSAGDAASRRGTARGACTACASSAP